MNFEILTDLKNEVMYEGMIIDYKVSPLPGYRTKWRTQIKNIITGKEFTDTQLAGPYRKWEHRHIFIPVADGVLMKDELRYQLPFGIIGQFAHWLFIRKKIQSIFDYREKSIEKIFNSSDTLTKKLPHA